MINGESPSRCFDKVTKVTEVYRIHSPQSDNQRNSCAGRNAAPRWARRLSDGNGLRTRRQCSRYGGRCANLRGEGAAGDQSTDRACLASRSGAGNWPPNGRTRPRNWPAILAGAADARAPETAERAGHCHGRRRNGRIADSGSSRGSSLLEAAEVPVACASANRSNEISPTTAEHVRKSLGDAVDVLLDGGPTPGGLESTVLDLSSESAAAAAAWFGRAGGD